MAMIYLLVILSFIAGVVVYQSRRQKRRPGEQPLISSSGIVDTPLNPHGSVLIDGELFVARSVDGAFIPAHAKVTVVGLSDHLVLIQKT